MPNGVVKLSHYETLLACDLHADTALRAVPKLTLKHVDPNNVQQMSVSIAAQVSERLIPDVLQLLSN